MGKLGLVKIKTGGLRYTQMLPTIKAMIISDDGMCNEEQEQMLMPQPKARLPMAQTDADKHGVDKDNKDKDIKNQENDCMPYISWETVHNYLVCKIGHVQEYT